MTTLTCREGRLPLSAVAPIQCATTDLYSLDADGVSSAGRQEIEFHEQ